jgi:uncharacterized protein (TIGR03067 family)
MTRSVLLSLILTAPLLAAPAEPGPDAKADAKTIQGTWSIVSVDGPDKPPEEFKKAKFVFEKDSLTITGGPRKEDPVKFKLAVKKGQGEIDIQPPRDVKPVEGLYKFEKDQLTLTFFKPGKGRPTKFGDSEAMTVVLKKDGKKEEKKDGKKDK